MREMKAYKKIEDKFKMFVDLKQKCLDTFFILRKGYKKQLVAGFKSWSTISSVFLLPLLIKLETNSIFSAIFCKKKKKIAFSLQNQITQNFHYNKHKIAFCAQHDFIQVDILKNHKICKISTWMKSCKIRLWRCSLPCCWACSTHLWLRQWKLSFSIQ